MGELFDLARKNNANPDKLKAGSLFALARKNYQEANPNAPKDDMDSRVVQFFKDADSAAQNYGSYQRFTDKASIESNQKNLFSEINRLEDEKYSLVDWMKTHKDRYTESQANDLNLKLSNALKALREGRKSADWAEAEYGAYKNEGEYTKAKYGRMNAENAQLEEAKKLQKAAQASENYDFVSNRKQLDSLEKQYKQAQKAYQSAKINPYNPNKDQINAKYADLKSKYEEKSKEYANASKYKKYKTVEKLPSFLNYNVEVNPKEKNQTYQYVNNINDVQTKYATGIGVGGGSGDQQITALFRLTEEEKKKYNYFYNADGIESANRYIEYILPTVKSRIAQESIDNVKNVASEHPLAASALTLADQFSTPAGYISNIIDTVSGKGIDKNSTLNVISKARSAIRQTVSDEYASKWFDGASFLGENVGQQLYATMMSMGDNLVQMGIGAVIGGGLSGGGIDSIREAAKTAEKITLAIMGTGAAQQNVMDALESGKTDAQAMTLGTIAGAAEIVTEKFSLDNLLREPKKYLTYILKNIFVEGTEEVGSDIINELGDMIVMGNKAEAFQKVREYQRLGMTEGEAAGKVIAEFASQCAWSFAGGAVSGGLFAGAHIAGQFYENARNDISTGKSILANNNQQQLVTDAKSAGGKAEKLANRYADALTPNDGNIDSQGSISDARKAGKLRRVAMDSLVDSKGKVQYAAIRNYIASKGVDHQQANEMTIKIRRVIEGGEDVKAKDMRAVFNDPVAAQMYTAVMQNEKLSKQIYEEQRSNSSLFDSIMKSTQENTLTEQQKAVLDSISLDMPSNVSQKETTQQTLEKSGNAPVLIADWSDFKGKMSFAAFDKMNSDYQGEDPVAYSSAYQKMYDQGKSGKPYLASEMKTDGVLTNAQMRSAWEAGHDTYQSGAAKSDAAIPKKTKPNKQSEVSFAKNVDVKTLSEKQNASVSAATQICNALGVNVRFFDSEKDGRADNGLYNRATNTIELDVNAWFDGKSQDSVGVINALSHEITHAIAEWSPAKYADLKSFVLESVLQIKGKDAFNLRIAEIQAKYQEAFGQNLSEEDALDEMVANGCEQMLNDGSAMQQLKTEHHDIWQRIKEFFNRLLKDIQAAIKDTDANTMEAEIMKDFHDQMQQKFNAAFGEAAENIKNADLQSTANEAQKNTAGDGSVKYSFAGTHAKNYHLSSLEKAKKMEEVGKASSEEIRQETGWFKGYDGKWRFEISDDDMELTGFDVTRGDATLGDVLKHDKLFEQYPQLRKIKVVVMPESLLNLSTKGGYSDKNKKIMISSSLLKNKAAAEEIKNIKSSSAFIEFHDKMKKEIEKEAKKRSEIKAEFQRIKESKEYKSYVNSYYSENEEEMKVGIEKWKETPLSKRYDEMRREIKEMDKNPASVLVAEELKKQDFYKKLKEAEFEEYNGTDLLNTIDNRRILIHEIQHAIQYEEGFASGSSPKYWEEMIEGGFVSNDSYAYGLYERTAGEVEARDTANRYWRSDEQRKNTRPDIDRTDVVFADGAISLDFHSEEAMQYNEEGLTERELLENVLKTAESFDGRYLFFGRFSTEYRKFLTDNGVEVKDLPILMNYRDAYISMESKENGKYQNEHINYHNIGIDGMMSAIEELKNPVATMLSKKDGKVELALKFKDSHNQTGLAIILLNTSAQNSKEFIEAHIVNSIYGRRNIENYISKADQEGRLLKKEIMQGIPRVQYKGDINTISSDTKITQSTPGVNTNISESAQNDASPVEKHSAKDDNSGEAERIAKRILEAQKEISNLKAQLKPSEYNEARVKDVHAAAVLLKKEYGSKVAVPDLEKQFFEMYNMIVNENAPMQHVFDKADHIAGMVVDNVTNTVRGKYSQDILDAIKSVTFKLNDTQRAEAINSFGSFKSWYNSIMGYGKYRIDGGMTLDEMWQSLSEAYPDVFSKDTVDADMPLELARIIRECRNDQYDVLDGQREALRQDIAEQVYSTALGLQRELTFADRQNIRVENERRRTSEAIQQVRKTDAERKKEALDKQRQKDAQIKNKALEKQRIKYQSKFAQTIRELNSNNARMLQKQKEYYKQVGRNIISARQAKDDTKVIIQVANELSVALEKPTAKKHIPEFMRGALASYLSSLEFLKKDLAVKEDLDPYVSSTLKNFVKSMSRLSRLEDSFQMESSEQVKSLDLDPKFFKLMKDIREIADQYGNTDAPTSINAEDIHKLYQATLMLRQMVNKVNKLYTIHEETSALADETMSYMDKIKHKQTRSNLVLGVKKLSKAAYWSMMTPSTAFERLGPGGEKVFASITKAQSEYAFLLDEITRYAAESYTAEQSKEWSKKTITIETSAGIINMTVGQVISFYETQKRSVSENHLLNGGIKIKEMEGAAITAGQDVIQLSQEDILKIIGKLTPEQKQVGDKLQKFLSGPCADLANETHMKRFGYRAFTEPGYWPMHVYDADKPNGQVEQTKVGSDESVDMYRIMNPSWSKPVNENAVNILEIRDCFDEFTQHAVEVAAYNAYCLPVLDAIRWMNYREVFDSSQTPESKMTSKSVRASMDSAFGKYASDYVRKLIMDINGETKKDSINMSEKISSKLISAAKIAAVGGNLRVAALQVTALHRAQILLNEKYIIRGLAMKNGREQMKKYSGCALWKSFGYFDTNVATPMQKQIKQTDNWLDKTREFSMKGAELADDVTWGVIWNACVLETRDNMKSKKGVKITEKQLETLYQKASERFDEIIYKTQVMDSVLTRSQAMRTNSTYGKVKTAFMAEPILTLNTLFSAANKIERANITGTGKKEAVMYLGRTTANYIISQMIISAVEAAFLAGRDDDEYKSFLEKYGESYLESLIGNMSLIGKVPLLKDMVSIISGYSSTGLEMRGLENLIDACKNWYKRAIGERSTPIYGDIYLTASGLSSIIGVPVSNAMRDLVAMYNTIYPVFGKIRRNAQKTDGVYDKLYGYVSSGEVEKAQALRKRMLANGVKEDTITNKMKELLMANQTGIVLAAQAKAFGDLKAFASYKDTISVKGFSDDDILAAIKSAESKMKSNARTLGAKKKDSKEYQNALKTLHGFSLSDSDIEQLMAKYPASQESEPEEKSIYNATDINNALENGDMESFTIAFSDLYDYKFRNYDREKEDGTELTDDEVDAKVNSGIRSGVTRHWKEKYLAADAEEQSKILDMLYQTGLYGSYGDLIETVSLWK